MLKASEAVFKLFIAKVAKFAIIEGGLHLEEMGFVMTVLGAGKTLVNLLAMGDMSMGAGVIFQRKLGAPLNAMEKLIKGSIRMGMEDYPVKESQEVEYYMIEYCWKLPHLTQNRGSFGSQFMRRYKVWPLQVSYPSKNANLSIKLWKTSADFNGKPLYSHYGSWRDFSPGSCTKTPPLSMQLLAVQFHVAWMTMSNVNTPLCHC
ncbi:unnamed protein product [Ilex paraguariensis]|uniref:Uncharacterized protein n=1 Tax=Ilex paraguariensis TaxID=185542 RepID=A0ABC8RK73_9AQUA